MRETTSATKLNGKGRHSGVSVRSYNSIPGTVLRQEPQPRQATGVATRVLQRDPIGYAGGVNLYVYVGGRAVAAVDPRGTDVQTACQSRCWQTCGNNDGPACQSCITCCEYAGDDPRRRPNAFLLRHSLRARTPSAVGVQRACASNVAGRLRLVRYSLARQVVQPAAPWQGESTSNVS